MDKRDSTTIKVLLIFNLLALVVIFFLGSKKIDQQHNDLFSQVFQLHGRLSEVEAQLESAIGLLEGDTVVELVHSDYEIKNLNFTDRIAEININATLSAAPREAEVYLSYVEVDPESGANIESSRIDIQMEGSEELLYVIDLVVDMDRIYHFDFIAIDENGDTSDISHYESAIDIRNYLSMMRYYSSRITTFQEEEGVEFTLYYSVDNAGYDELNLEQAELTLILDNETFANLDVTSSITAIPSYLLAKEYYEKIASEEIALDMTEDEYLEAHADLVTDSGTKRYFRLRYFVPFTDYAALNSSNVAELRIQCNLRFKDGLVEGVQSTGLEDSEWVNPGLLR